MFPGILPILPSAWEQGWWYVAVQSVESCHAGLGLQRVAVVLQVVMSYCQTEQDDRFEGIFTVNTHNIGVGTTRAPGAGAPLDLAMLYGERLIEIIAKCVI